MVRSRGTLPLGAPRPTNLLPTNLLTTTCHLPTYLRTCSPTTHLLPTTYLPTYHLPIYLPAASSPPAARYLPTTYLSIYLLLLGAHLYYTCFPSCCQVRNLADAIVVYEQQFKLRYDKKELPVLQILADARYVLSVVKDKVSSE